MVARQNARVLSIHYPGTMVCYNNTIRLAITFAYRHLLVTLLSVPISNPKSIGQDPWVLPRFFLPSHQSINDFALAIALATVPANPRARKPSLPDTWLGQFSRTQSTK
jgi:hypothetical protein